MKRLIALLTLIACVIMLSAEDTPTQNTSSISIFDPLFSKPQFLEDNPSKYLGFFIKQTLEKFGIPDSVYTVRGNEAWQDDVVFRYSPGYDFFWFKDRIWQIRFTSKYKSLVLGIKIGDTQEKAISLLGLPYVQTETYMIFRLPDQGYPIHLRIILVQGIIQDIYVYRADF